MCKLSCCTVVGLERDMPYVVHVVGRLNGSGVGGGIDQFNVSVQNVIVTLGSRQSSLLSYPKPLLGIFDLCRFSSHLNLRLLRKRFALWQKWRKKKKERYYDG